MECFAYSKHLMDIYEFLSYTFHERYISFIAHIYYICVQKKIKLKINLYQRVEATHFFRTDLEIYLLELHTAVLFC